MKNTLYKLSVIFLILLSACSTLNQQIATPTIYLVPTTTVLSTKTPVQATQTAARTTTVIVETPTKDYDVLLSGLLPNCGNAELSPSQSWATGFCKDDETWIINVNQTAKWVISYGEYYGNKFDSGNGVIAPFYWTSDSKYLYLTIQRGVSGPIYFANGWGLIRLDLVSGQISEILNPIQHHYYSFSLSSDGKYLAYILQSANPLTLNIVNLKTGDTVSFGIKAQYNQAGRIIWSPDKSKIVFGQATIDYDEKNPNLFSIVMINLANGSRQTIVQNSSLEITPQIWVDENTIELKDIDGKSWIFDLQNNSLLEKKR